MSTYLLHVEHRGNRYTLAFTSPSSRGYAIITLSGCDDVTLSVEDLVA